MTAAQTLAISSLKDFSISSWSTLVLADKAANLLSSANAGATTKATSVQLTGGSNGVTAAQAKTLAGLKGFSVGVGAT